MDKRKKAIKSKAKANAAIDSSDFDLNNPNKDGGENE